MNSFTTRDLAEVVGILSVASVVAALALRAGFGHPWATIGGLAVAGGIWLMIWAKRS